MQLVMEGITLTVTYNSRKQQWGERRKGFGCKEMQSSSNMIET